MKPVTWKLVGKFVALTFQSPSARLSEVPSEGISQLPDSPWGGKEKTKTNTEQSDFLRDSLRYWFLSCLNLDPHLRRHWEQAWHSRAISPPPCSIQSLVQLRAQKGLSKLEAWGLLNTEKEIQRTCSSVAVPGVWKKSGAYFQCFSVSGMLPDFCLIYLGAVMELSLL